jgi:hypothetical protein
MPYLRPIALIASDFCPTAMSKVPVLTVISRKHEVTSVMNAAGL